MKEFMLILCYVLFIYLERTQWIFNGYGYPSHLDMDTIFYSWIFLWAGKDCLYGHEYEFKIVQPDPNLTHCHPYTLDRHRLHWSTTFFGPTKNIIHYSTAGRGPTASTSTTSKTETSQRLQIPEPLNLMPTRISTDLCTIPSRKMWPRTWHLPKGILVLGRYYKRNLA